MRLDSVMPIWEVPTYRSRAARSSTCGSSRVASQWPSSAMRLTRLRRTPTAANSPATYRALAAIRATMISQAVTDMRPLVYENGETFVATRG